MKHVRLPRLVPWLAAGLLASSCVYPLPEPYDGDYSEFRAKREAAEAARAERERLREEALAAAAAQAKIEAEAPPPAPDDEGPVPFVPVLPPDGESQARTDEDISRDVRAEIAGTPLLQGRRLAISVESGVVTLEGIVLNAGEATAAVFAASRVAGVNGVYDLLELEPRREVGAKRFIDSDDFYSPEFDATLRKLVMTDYDVERAIEAAFARTPELDASSVEVYVERGLVILSGSVLSARDRRLAANLARDVGGRGVRNELEILPAHGPARPQPKSPL